MTLAWAPGGSFGSPTYTLPIKVVDGMRSTLIGERRKIWREASELALSEWGLPFDLTYRPEADQPFRATDATISNLSVNPLIVPNAIALVHLHALINSDSAGWVQSMGGGICLFSPWRAWWMQRGKSEIAGIVAHEVGHALGFGHGGNGVMSGNNKPNDQERSLVATYYGTGG